MNKAFVKETSDDDTLPLLPEMPVGVRNYITPAGYQHLQDELQQLTDVARPDALQDEGNDTAAPSNERHDRPLREVDQRIHYLQARLETAEIVDPSVHAGGEQIFFGATVTYQNATGELQTVTIVGLDEIDPAHGRISWLSPVAQTLLNAYTGDVVMLESPAGDEELTILDVRYPARS